MNRVFHFIENMKSSPFFALKNIQGNEIDFHRSRYDGKHFGNHCKRGVYFWGFYLGNNRKCIPEKPEDIVIYYIGKEQGNVSQRIMQEFTQFIIGGFGTIIHNKWLIEHPFDADLYNKQESDKTGLLDKDVLYKSYGLHVLHDFYYNSELRPTINWMFERLIFAWVVDDKNTKAIVTEYEKNLDNKIIEKIKNQVNNDTKKYQEKINNRFLAHLESELHHIVGRNTFGLGPNPPKNIKDVNDKKKTPLFNSIDWTDNETLKKWILETNKRQITSP